LSRERLLQTEEAYYEHKVTGPVWGRIGGKDQNVFGDQLMELRKKVQGGEGKGSGGEGVVVTRRQEQTDGYPPTE
jgi:hypothetical protein